MNFNRNPEKLLKMFLSALVGILVLIFGYSLFKRQINVDDAWLGEPAMQLAKNGWISSQILFGWEGAEERLLFTHKLFVIIGSWFVKLFGYGVYQLKAVSLVYYVGLIGTWLLFMARQKLPTVVSLLFLVLLLGNSFYFEYAFIFRPEVALSFYASWIFFLLAKEDLGGTYRATVVAGVLSAIAIGHHLNGLIFLGAGGLLLLFNRRIKEFFIFGVIGILGLTFYLYEIHNLQELNLMLRQFSNTQDMKEHSSVFQYFFRILDEQRRYLHSGREATLTVLFSVSLWSGYSTLKKRYPSMIIFLFSTMAGLAIISHGKTSKYLLLPMAFMLFLTCVALIDRWKDYVKTFSLLGLLYFAFQMDQNLKVALNKDERAQFLQPYFDSEVPAGQTMVGPMEFSFAAWQQHPLQAAEVYRILGSSSKTPEGLQLVQNQFKKANVGLIFAPAWFLEQIDLFDQTQFGDFKHLRHDPYLGVEVFVKK